MGNLAAELNSEGDHQSAEPLYRRALAIRRELADANPTVRRQALVAAQSMLDPAEHDGVKRLFDLNAARLIAEGHTAADPDYVFRRFRINER
jgi:hypothetical protein